MDAQAGRDPRTRHRHDPRPASRARGPGRGRRHRGLLRAPHLLALERRGPRSRDGRELAWNLVEGVNDPARDSERRVWIDGHPVEVAPVAFAADLSAVGGLSFAAEATRERTENRLLVRSRYRQPFGSFSGAPAPGVTLAEGHGVMEEHDVWW